MKTKALAYLAALFLVSGLPLDVANAKGTPPGLDCEWFAGDLHVHTTYSHDSYGGPSDDNTGPEEGHTWGWSVGEQAALAEARGLDFISITDHNDVRSVSDEGYGTRTLEWIPGYENSLKGHAQMLGTTKVLKNGKGDLEDVRQLVREMHSLGGIFQVNHPSDREWIEAYGDAIVPDAIEVWNLGPWIYQPPFPAANDNDFALTWYDSFLDRGFHVTATGGSDNHWRSVTPLAGVGQPTTWVCARKRQPHAILEGIRKGRTFITHQPPVYEQRGLVLGIDFDDDFVFEKLVGDTVAVGSTLDVFATGGNGDYRLRLVGDDSKTLQEWPDAGHHNFPVPEGVSWIRAELYHEDAEEQRPLLQPLCDLLTQVAELFGEGEATYCRNRLVMVALTSPIYVR